LGVTVAAPPSIGPPSNLCAVGGTVIYDKFDLDLRRGELISEFPDIEKNFSHVTSSF
jgi:hypothetical protein